MSLETLLQNPNSTMQLSFIHWPFDVCVRSGRLIYYSVFGSFEDNSGPCLPNGPITQLSPYLTQNPCMNTTETVLPAFWTVVGHDHRRHLPSAITFNGTSSAAVAWPFWICGQDIQVKHLRCRAIYSKSGGKFKYWGWKYSFPWVAWNWVINLRFVHLLQAGERKLIMQSHATHGK